jgi:hypothetical protein
MKMSVFKGYVTSAIGTITMVLTLILLWQRVVGFVWEGVAGLCIGCILFLAPQAIENIVSKGVGYFTKNSQSQADECVDGIKNVTTPPNPPRKI